MLALELYAIAAGIDIAISISTILAIVMQCLKIERIPIIVYINSLLLYEYIIKLRTTKEKRLMIDIIFMKESYERREILEIRWIDGRDNPADALTKKAPNDALAALISTNRTMVRIEAYVERT